MAEMQFLVTLSGVNPRLRKTQDQVVGAIVGYLGATPLAEGCEHILARPLPDLAVDDTDLQLGFRRLTSAYCTWGSDHAMDTKVPLDLTRGQISALVAELTKEHPARTAHVDQAALEALYAIRKSDAGPGLPVQKNARAQLAIIDAICRCMPEEGK